MSSRGDKLEDRLQQIEEALRIQAAITALFAKTDEESKDKQRVIRIALGLE